MTVTLTGLRGSILRKTVGLLVGYARPRLASFSRRPGGGWGFVTAEPGIRLENRRSIEIGPRTRLLRNATVMANGGPVSIGSESVIARYAVVQSVGGSIRIGDRTSVGDFANLYGHGGLLVGDDVLMASGVRIVTAEHTFESREVPISQQPEKAAPTVIENGAWLASNVVVLAGVTVGEGAICAAGAVVTRDVAPYTVVAGVPARVVRDRP